jgi:hypothetical protein
MQVSNVPPVDVPTVRTGSVTTAEQGPPTAADVAPAADLADIRPLDISGALQILLAEVRAALDLQLSAAITTDAIPSSAHMATMTATATASAAAATAAANTAGAIAQSPDQAAHQMVEMFLQALPEDASDAPAWTAALVRADAAMQSSIEQAIGAVTQWREVPAAAVDAVADTRALFIAALGDEPQNPLWLRPEWVGLAPVLHRFRRRRRNARRRLTDPDYSTQSLDENEEFR